MSCNILPNGFISCHLSDTEHWIWIKCKQVNKFIDSKYFKKRINKRSQKSSGRCPKSPRWPQTMLYDV